MSRAKCKQAIELIEMPLSDAPDQIQLATVRRVEENLDRVQDLWEMLEVQQAPAASYPIPAGMRLSVVIPVYNERATIFEILARVRALPLETEIIVVDDGSTDGTRGWLQTVQKTPGLKIILKPRNEGKGAALRSGFAAATGDVVVIQDADLEYDPSDLLEVIRPIVEGRADVVYGSRFLGPERQDHSFFHRTINRLLTMASNAFTGLRLTDMETCHKAFRRNVIGGLPLRQNRFGFEPEVTAKLARRRYRIVEQPIRYAPRSYAQGKKIGPRDAVNALWCIVRYGLSD
jgi:glycosyltransferase involved in cell wall biosynthesis